MNASWRDSAARALDSLWYGGNRLYWLLWPIAFVVGVLAALRRSAYRRGWLESVDVGVPVVVVGNLTAGGTGKTPLTIWLAQRLVARGLRVGIVCRGYGGAADTWPQRVGPDSDAAAVGDESKLLALKTACPVAAAPDRVAAARALLASDPLDVVLADDGLQHYRLQRAFEIVVIDGTRRLGNGLCLPAGPLREPAGRMADADAVVVNEGPIDEQGVYRAHLGAVLLANLKDSSARALDEFRGRRVHAVAAIGNPQRFFAALEQAGLIVEAHAHADHAALAAEDLSFGDGLPVLITEKDAVKYRSLGGDDVWVVMAELQFAAGDGERLLERVEHNLNRRAPRP